MSDPVSNDDVDLVLTSIRRLVVEKKPEADGANDRFVLTDALRVAEPREGAMPESGSEEPAEESPVSEMADPSQPAGKEGRGADPVLLTAPRLEGPGDLSADASQTAPRPDESLLKRIVSREVSRSFEAPETETALRSDQDADGVGATDVASDWTGAKPDAAGVLGPIDEDRLRALVAELVREELQGALGERITRNVRKLVRREIHRVLLSREYE